MGAAATTDGRVQHATNGSTNALPHHGPGPDDATTAAANGLEPAADSQQHVGQPEGRPSTASYLQYSMDSNQMMMHRDNVHDMSDMRLRDMQQQQHGMQSNLNRLDMNNQRMRMNNRQQMQQYRLDNDINP